MTITGATTRTAQLTAIEQSGWGTRFKLFQPHNAAFWVAGGSDPTPWYLAMFNAAARKS